MANVKLIAALGCTITVGTVTGCQSMWVDVPREKTTAKVALDASWYQPSGMANEQIDSLVQQRRRHIEQTLHQRGESVAGDPTTPTHR